MYDIIGKEIRICTFFKEFRDGENVVASHSIYHDIKVKSVTSLVSDYSGGWSQYILLMENGMLVNYFSPNGLK